MTEKEEKAIKIVRKFNIENRFRDCGVLNNSIEIVLQALEQKDKEISELKEDNQHQWDERCKLTFAYDKDTHTLQNQLDVANADLYECNNIISDYIDTVKEKDKIIDVIVQEYEYNAGINVKDFCKEEMRKDKCIQDCRCCIKKFFEMKVMK